MKLRKWARTGTGLDARDAVLVQALRVVDELVGDRVGHVNAGTAVDALACLGDAQVLASDAVVDVRPDAAAQTVRVAAVERARPVAPALASAVTHRFRHYIFIRKS